MFVLALTGPIASGKSAVIEMLRAMGIPTVSADDLVHSLQQAGTAETAFLAQRLGTEVLHADGSLNRDKLGQLATIDETIFPLLEQTLLPPLKQLFYSFVEQHHSSPLVVLEIPLLFQRNTGIPHDASATCLCPLALRKARALKRPMMTEAKFNAITARQPEDMVFAARADYLIQTGGTMAETQQQVAKLAASLKEKAGGTWPAQWQHYLKS